MAMCANRLCEPESKLGVWDRWLDKVYRPGCKDLKFDQIYEAMDLLYEHTVELVFIAETCHLYQFNKISRYCGKPHRIKHTLLKIITMIFDNHQGRKYKLTLRN